ncbi:MAG: phytanoyl-CoA dioxygenase, partial [Gemmatimonadota bacterium]|nr:phytanoyl-CoA dioxygenase [Gemmatimonadota bacterium]
VVRYAPWWLNLNVLRPGSADRRILVDETGITENLVPTLPKVVFDGLPGELKPLVSHWVE